ncbi:MAG: hypothetical protein WA175_01940 [Candidatus Acidiferrales bacterium]
MKFKEFGRGIRIGLIERFKEGLEHLGQRFKEGLERLGRGFVVEIL